MSYYWYILKGSLCFSLSEADPSLASVEGCLGNVGARLFHLGIAHSKGLYKATLSYREHRETKYLLELLGTQKDVPLLLHIIPSTAYSPLHGWPVQLAGVWCRGCNSTSSLHQPLKGGSGGASCTLPHCTHMTRPSRIWPRIRSLGSGKLLLLILKGENWTPGTLFSLSLPDW